MATEGLPRAPRRAHGQKVLEHIRKHRTNLENLENIEIGNQRKSAKVSENVRLGSGAAGGQIDWCQFVCPATGNYHGVWWPGFHRNLYAFCVLVLPGPGEVSHGNSGNRVFQDPGPKVLEHIRKHLTNLENIEIRKSANVSENVRLASGAAGGQIDWCQFVCPDTSNYHGAWWPGLPANLYTFCVLVFPWEPGEVIHGNGGNRVSLGAPQGSWLKSPQVVQMAPSKCTLHSVLSWLPVHLHLPRWSLLPDRLVCASKLHLLTQVASSTIPPAKIASTSRLWSTKIQVLPLLQRGWQHVQHLFHLLHWFRVHRLRTVGISTLEGTVSALSGSRDLQHQLQEMTPDHHNQHKFYRRLWNCMNVILMYHRYPFYKKRRTSALRHTFRVKLLEVFRCIALFNQTSTRSMCRTLILRSFKGTNASRPALTYRTLARCHRALRQWRYPHLRARRATLDFQCCTSHRHVASCP